MQRFLLLTLLVSCAFFSTAHAQPGNSLPSAPSTLSHHNHHPHHRPPQPPPQPEYNGYPPPYPVTPYPYDYGWSAMGEAYMQQPAPMQDPGSHITINGKTFPSKNAAQQGARSSVQVDGQ